MGWFHILAFKGIPHGDADSYLSQKFKKSMELMSWKFYSFHVHHDDLEICIRAWTIMVVDNKVQFIYFKAESKWD